MANPQANTRAHDLSRYGSSDAPDDWSDEDAGYNPIPVQIWAAWLPVLALLLSLPTLSGEPATIIGPWLSWYAPDQANLLFVVLWLNFCPERLVNALAEGHPASALRTDGSLRSDCWELVHLSLGGCFWLCCKLNIWPWHPPLFKF